MNLFELFVKIGVDDQASDKISNLSSKLGNGLKTAAKIGTAAVGAAAAGITALTTAAVNNYAEYEQLVGGVETLFKQSADVVQQYAANAYKTAGLSANEYMSTVTSFSASLLQSLGGDTESAAKYADMAITDMSDNANKMGTDMELIQNAYRGFAKSNYTMLDNLALGYGGTKEEMQRLLDDAEKLSGIEYDISSYADIVDAIHVVQTEIGITGTTAKEASSTISGSVSSMKSAWSNLVSGLADENANLDVLIENFVDSVVTAGENVIPRVEQILSGIGTAVTKLAPFISEAVPELVTNALPALLDAGVQLIGGLLQGLITALPALAGSAVSIVDTLATTIVEQLPALLVAAVEVIVTLANGIAESLPELIPTIVDVVIQIVETLIDNVDMLVDAAIAIIIALAEGLINSLPELIEEIPGLVIKIVNAIIENAPKLLESSAEIIAKLTSGLIEGFGEIAIKVGGWLYDNIVQPIIDKVSDFKDAGKQLLEGLWNGISDKVEWLKGKVSGVIDTIKGWFTGKDGFDEHSPSKWSKQVFRYVMEGGGEGLEDGLPDLMKDVRIVTNKVKGGLDFGTATVDFASSGLGASSVNIINSASSANEANTVGGPVTINLMFPDGTQFASYLLPNLIDVAKASGTPIVNPA